MLAPLSPQLGTCISMWASFPWLIVCMGLGEQRVACRLLYRVGARARVEHQVWIAVWISPGSWKLIRMGIRAQWPAASVCTKPAVVDTTDIDNPQQEATSGTSPSSMQCAVHLVLVSIASTLTRRLKMSLVLTILRGEQEQTPNKVYGSNGCKCIPSRLSVGPGDKS